jgi:lipopolysaccharide transport system permease protein
MLSDLVASRELAWRLFMRDFRAQYRQSYLGYIWAFVPPLVGSLTFVLLTSMGLFKSGVTVFPYAAFAMIGTMLWQAFADSIAMPLSSMNQAKPMLSKINFPRESILLAGLMMVICNFLIRFLLLIGILICFRIVPSSTLLIFPLAVLALIMCGTAFGLALVPLGGLYGDIGRLIPMVSSCWMLLTPVVYPAKSLGFIGWLSTWNPVSPLVITARESLTGLSITHFPQFLCVFGFSTLAVLIGWIGFRVTIPHLIIRMGG